MTYNLKYDVPAPVEMYDAAHSAIKELIGDTDIGLIVHVGYPTDQGFGIVEVWESRDSFDKFIADVWPQAAAKIHLGDMEAPHAQAFEIHGLIVAATKGIYT